MKTISNLLILIFTFSWSISLSHANTSLGAYIKHDGWSLEDIQKFNSETDKPMAITTLFTNFNMNWDSLNIQASNIVTQKATPMITLMPFSDRDPDTLSAIISGTEDEYINDWILGFKAWKDTYPADEQPKILLRFAHEFNGNWFPWSNNPENFKSAWAHIHNLFENANINDSVQWVWCASATSTDDYDDLTVYYPGDDMVDWTSLDGFNRGSNYSFSSWRSFDEIFSYAYTTLVNNYPDKPIILAEVGSAEPSDLPNPEWEQYGDDSDASNSKEEWISDMFNRIRQDYPAIQAISWFNNNKELSWALNDIAQNGLPNTGINAYNSSIQHDHYLSTLVPLPEFEIDNDDDSDTPTYIRRGRNNPERSKARPAIKYFIKTNIQRALALSKMPKVVGEKLREKEANGFRNLSQQALSRITMKRLSLSK